MQPILREEVEIAVASLKKGKSAGVDNIPAELVQAGGETMIDVLTEICNRIWRTGEWPTPWTQSLIITLPKKGNLQLCQNYRTISLISHSSKVMLKVILNRLKPQAEEIIAEEQAGFRAGRSTTEQIFNLRILCEKYLQHQQNLYHVFIDFKKAFGRVWHAALWATMRKYNISANLVRTIEQLYDKATSAVQMNGSIGEWFRTTVGVRQGCLLSPTLFNIFLEQIMSDALEEHDGTVSIGGRNITNLRFADDIDAQAEEEQELEALVESLDKTYTRYKMAISAEKTKLMTNSANDILREIKVKGQKLGTVTSFKYLGAVVSDDGSKPEVLSRIAQATAALTKLKPIWRDNNISLGSKVKLMRSLVISIFLYACESWTLTAELEKRTQAFEMRCYRRLLNISYKDHVTNEEVRRKIQAAIEEYDELLTLVKKRLAYSSPGTSTVTLQENIERNLTRLGQFIHTYLQFQMFFDEIKMTIQNAIFYIGTLKTDINMLALNYLSTSTISPGDLKALLIEIQSKLAMNYELPKDPNIDIWYFYKTAMYDIHGKRSNTYCLENSSN